MLSVKQEVVNINFKVIGLTRLGIKPKSTAVEMDTLTTWPSELLNALKTSLHPLKVLQKCRVRKASNSKYRAHTQMPFKKESFYFTGKRLRNYDFQTTVIENFAIFGHNFRLP